MKNKRQGENGEFWQEGVNNSIQFDPIKLKKYLNIPNINIGASTNGRDKYLTVTFENEDDFIENNIKSIVNKLINYKIRGKDVLMEIPRNGTFGNHENEEKAKYHIDSYEFEIRFNLNKELSFY